MDLINEFLGGRLKGQTVEGGWSGDDKIHLSIKEEEYLIRRSLKEKIAGREYQGRLQHLLPPCPAWPKYLDQKTIENDHHSLWQWLPGQKAEEARKEVSREEVFALGQSAGELLKRLHEIPVPEELQYD